MRKFKIIESYLEHDAQRDPQVVWIGAMEGGNTHLVTCNMTERSSQEVGFHFSLDSIYFVTIKLPSDQIWKISCMEM